MSNKDDRYPPMIHLFPEVFDGDPCIAWDESGPPADAGDPEDTAAYIRADIAEERFQKMQRELEEARQEIELIAGAKRTGDMDVVDYLKALHAVERFEIEQVAKNRPDHIPSPPFAKTFFVDEFGQILVTLEKHPEHGPMVSYFINGESLGLGMVSAAQGWDFDPNDHEDIEKVWRAAKTYFLQLDEKMATDAARYIHDTTLPASAQVQ